MRAQIKRHALLVAKVFFSTAVLGYFLLTIDLDRLGLVFSRASVPLLVLVALLSVGRVFFAAWRFTLLLAPHAPQPFGLVLRHCFIGNLFNQVLPTAVGGDAVRVVLLHGDGGVPRTEGAIYVLVERALGLCALGVIAIVAAPLAKLPPEVALVSYATGAGIVGGALVIVVIARFGDVTRLRPAIVRRAVLALRAVAGHPRILVAALLLSVAFQGLGIVASWLIGVSLDLPIAPAAYFAVVPLVYLATVLPISLGGIGLRELAFVGLFGALGVSEEASLAVSLGTYASLVLPGLVGGAFWLLRARLRAD